MDESVVTMNLLEGEGDAGYLITFSEAESAAQSPEQPAPEQPGLQDYQFNKEIKVITDFQSFEFDRRGMVKNPGQITLVSLTDESVTTQILVE